MYVISLQELETKQQNLDNLNQKVDDLEEVGDLFSF